MTTHMVVGFGNQRLTFAVEDSPLGQLWLKKMQMRHDWPLDDPERFYHFNSYQQERLRAERMLRTAIRVINQHRHIIKKPFTSVYDQDLMNYLHNIFERYHGMLDQQHHDYWMSVPDHVRQALCDLNLAVHRCEYLQNRRPEIVCTWFGMPKTDKLSLEMRQKFGRLGSEFGGVYLNYADIGKEAFSLAHNQDVYIADEMFKPFEYYSADFIMTFYDTSQTQLDHQLKLIQQYFDQHRDFFNHRGIFESQDVRIMPYRYKVAHLVHDPQQRSAILKLISRNQHISSIDIT